MVLIHFLLLKKEKKECSFQRLMPIEASSVSLVIIRPTESSYHLSSKKKKKDERKG